MPVSEFVSKSIPKSASISIALAITGFANTSVAAQTCEGAFLPNQRFLFALEETSAPAGTRRLSGVPVVQETLTEAYANSRKALVTLAADATFDDPTYERSPLSAFEMRQNDDLVKLVTLTLSDGAQVTLRAEHSVASPYGDPTPAADVRLGQSLLKANGNYGLVRGIESSPSYDPLFVLQIAHGASNRAPWLVSEDVLVGLPNCAPF
jgi:hypothetical protein